LKSSGGIALEYLFIVDALVKVITFDDGSMEFFALIHDLKDLLLDLLRRNDVGLVTH
jgi:hypothetical protein